MIATAEDGVSLFVYPGFQIYFFYAAAEKRALAKMLQMECITILAISIFVGYCRLQHAGAKWEESVCLRYHVYTTLPQVSVKDATCFI